MNICNESGKITYSSKGEARAVSFTIENRCKGHAKPYFCMDCGGWHLTSWFFKSKPNIKKRKL